MSHKMVSSLSEMRWYSFKIICNKIFKGFEWFTCANSTFNDLSTHVTPSVQWLVREIRFVCVAATLIVPGPAM